jgi:metal-responsive CopG/Arc/MetJ family transcriptional regulator
MLFEEFTDPIMPERQEPKEKPGYSDPELARTLDRVAAHYPYYKRGSEGFMKFAQRALKHSEETDQEHAARIAELADEIEQLKQTIAQLHQK